MDTLLIVSNIIRADLIVLLIVIVTSCTLHVQALAFIKC